MKPLFLLLLLIAGAACAEAKVNGPSPAEVLQAERELATSIRLLGKIGYPDVASPDQGEQPMEITNLKCDEGTCSYDLTVAVGQTRRTIHRPRTLFCQNPQDAWVSCVS